MSFELGFVGNSLRLIIYLIYLLLNCRSFVFVLYGENDEVFHRIFCHKISFRQADDTISIVWRFSQRMAVA